MLRARIDCKAKEQVPSGCPQSPPQEGREAAQAEDYNKGNRRRLGVHMLSSELDATRRLEERRGLLASFPGGCDGTRPVSSHGAFLHHPTANYGAGETPPPPSPACALLLQGHHASP